MERNICCLCNSSLEHIVTQETYPISFTMTNNDDYIYENLIFMECINCKTIQIKNLIDLKVLYNRPHNHSIIGTTWIEHFKEFAYIINKFKKSNGNVLEIGSPTDKIEKYVDNYSKWFLMDPNSVKYPEKNIKNLNEFFSEESSFDLKFDTIVHSHLLEHLYEPYKLLLKMREILTDDGDIFISIPNLHQCSFNCLFLGLNFEHTYLINEINMIYLANKCNLEITKKQYYKTHSIFYQLRKKSQPKNISIELIKEFNLGYKKLLLDKIQETKQFIEDLNIIIKNNENVYIFGCHSNTQIMLYFGLNTDYIKYILDNDPKKWDKKLYGYQLLCKKPDIIKNIKMPLIICNIGTYTDEIKIQLLEINSNVKIL